ncbi:hypothetical protein HELRODRAFT_160989 [Helobdella robusta]|uniref:Uncharacterized protein n=1 Tax=Helobdella robusta TaxID=6412 RepID=T1EQZ0_HELRO|nr:hypothetical protein HELRODRAFT_160989 [Helobdella robusta]ESO01820.1 hypothetical protein HELRODRAFT_160989 [Helobdella robusta]
MTTNQKILKDSDQPNEKENKDWISISQKKENDVILNNSYVVKYVPNLKMLNGGNLNPNMAASEIKNFLMKDFSNVTINVNHEPQKAEVVSGTFYLVVNSKNKLVAPIEF